MRNYIDSVANASGIPVSGASVTIYYTGTTTKPTIYSDDGVTPITNPVTTNSLGRYGFYVDDGRYDLVISGTGISTITLADQEIFDWKSKPVVMAHLQTGANFGAKIVNAMALVPAAGGTIDCRGLQGSQTITSSITVTKPIEFLFGASNISSAVIAFNIQSNGCSFKGQAGATTLTLTGSSSILAFYSNPSQGFTGTLASNAAEGQGSIALTAGQGASFSVGDYVIVSDSTAAFNTHCTKITGISGDALTFSDPLYNMGGFKTVNTSICQKMVSIDHTLIRDITIVATTNTGTATRHISLNYANFSTVEDVYCLGGGYLGGIYFFGGYNNRLTNATIENCVPSIQDSALAILAQTHFQLSNVKIHTLGNAADGVNVGSSHISSFSNLDITLNGNAANGNCISLFSSCANTFAGLSGVNSGGAPAAKGNGLYLTQGTSYNTFSDCVFENNNHCGVYSPGDTNGNTGTSCSNNSFTGCDLKNNAQQQYLDLESGANFGNSLTQCTVGPITTGSYMLTVSSKDFRLHNNYISDTSGNAIAGVSFTNVSGKGDRFSIVGNTFRSFASKKDIDFTASVAASGLIAHNNFGSGITYGGTGIGNIITANVGG